MHWHTEMNGNVLRFMENLEMTNILHILLIGFICIGLRAKITSELFTKTLALVFAWDPKVVKLNAIHNLMHFLHSASINVCMRRGKNLSAQHKIASNIQ